MRFLPRAKAVKGWMTHESASALASPVSSHASGYRKNNRESQEIFQMSIVAPVISPIAASAASAPRTPGARHVPLATQKVVRGPVMHRRLVVARGGEISWDEADEILTLEYVPIDTLYPPTFARNHPRPVARPARDLSVRFVP